MNEKPKAVVVDTSQSAHARLRPVPVDAVTLEDEFWAPRLRALREVTIPSQHKVLEETGRIDNFRLVAGKKSGEFEGIYFNDSDVYKWLEAASWTLASGHDDKIAHMVEEVVTEIADAQAAIGSDGYLVTYFTGERAAQRWSNLADMHELYCGGHLFQAAVAHHRATGSDRLLDVARRFADCICGVFGPGEGQREGAAGHAEIEMALVELARATGDEKYLTQAQFFVDCRGKGCAGGDIYHQDGGPFVEMDRMVGHAVRAVYLNAGATDLYAETGAKALRKALDKMWVNMTTTQMYLTGGVGSRYASEAFGRDYELPSERAYTETCAAIGSVMWNWRMLALEGDARYADVMERTLYNGVLSGLSLDGRQYFYMNPLTDDGTHRRVEWFHCACCPPNVVRVIASVPGLLYSVSAEGVWAHLYASNTADVELPDGRKVRLIQRTQYPWDGEVEIQVMGEGEFSLLLRVPAWAEKSAAVSVNRAPLDVAAKPCSYVEVRRTWSAGDTLRLSLPMYARMVACHPHVAENTDKVALMRGPLVYCIEGADNPDVDPRDVLLPYGAELSSAFRADVLGGVAVVEAQGKVRRAPRAWKGALYRRLSKSGGRKRATTLIAVPYYAWANREPGRMQVWMRVR